MNLRKYFVQSKISNDKSVTKLFCKNEKMHQNQFPFKMK